MAVVRHVLRKPDTDSPLRGKTVPIALVGGGFVPGEHSEIVEQSYPVTADGSGVLAAGTLSVDLTPNSQITPSGTHYSAKVPGVVAWPFVVPDGTPPNVDGSTRFWWLEDLLVTDPPTPGSVFFGVPTPTAVDDVLTATGTSPGDFNWQPASGGGSGINGGPAVTFTISDDGNFMPSGGGPDGSWYFD